jgi:hypothetical protein
VHHQCVYCTSLICYWCTNAHHNSCEDRVRPADLQVAIPIEDFAAISSEEEQPVSGTATPVAQQAANGSSDDDIEAEQFWANIGVSNDRVNDQAGDTGRATLPVTPDRDSLGSGSDRVNDQPGVPGSAMLPVPLAGNTVLNDGATDAAEVEQEAGRMSGYHAPPPQKQTGRSSGYHALSTQKHGQQQQDENMSSHSQTPQALVSQLREPQPGPGRCIDATCNTANEQPQHRQNNGNDDVDDSSKMHPPGAGQQHQQQQQQLQPATLAGSPHLTGGASQFPMQSGKRALHSSSSGPPPNKKHHST